MMPLRRVLVAPAVVLVALAGCAPAESTSSPTPAVTPSALCTPLFGGDPHACEQEELDDLTADRARYEEAAALYEDVIVETENLLAAKELISPDLAARLTGKALERTTSDLEAHAQSTSTITGHTRTEWVKPVDLSDAGSTLALELCSTAGTLVVEPSGAHPGAAVEQVFFVDTDGVLQVTNTKAEAVESC